jgi:DnaJ-class molecular chaperone
MKTFNAIMSAHAAAQFFKSAVDCGLRFKGSGDYALLRLGSDMGQSGQVKESIQIEKANTLMREASYFGAKVGSATVELLQGNTADFDSAIEGAIGDIVIEIGRIIMEHTIKNKQIIKSREVILEVVVFIECSNCSGTGTTDTLGINQCSCCNGTGRELV